MASHKFVVVVMCDSCRLNQSMSHRQSVIPAHIVPQGVWSPQDVLFAPLPSPSDFKLVRYYHTSRLLKNNLHVVQQNQVYDVIL